MANKKNSKTSACGTLTEKAISEIAHSLVCPYCGKKMRYVPYSKNDFYTNQMIFVCDDYPFCDTYCRAISNNHAVKLISTPANKTLRDLREEAKFYTKIILDNRIYPDAISLYSSIFKSEKKIPNINYCNEYMCELVIQELVKIMYKNKQKIGLIENQSRKKHNRETERLLKK